LLWWWSCGGCCDEDLPLAEVYEQVEEAPGLEAETLFAWERPWGKNSLNSRFQWLKLKLPFPAHCSAARHSMATDLLEAGTSTGTVAALLGHKDPTMVPKVYGKHIERRGEAGRSTCGSAWIKPQGSG
jgi:hypothetical protein